MVYNLKTFSRFPYPKSGSVLDHETLEELTRTGTLHRRLWRLRSPSLLQAGWRITAGAEEAEYINKKNPNERKHRALSLHFHRKTRKRKNLSSVS